MRTLGLALGAGLCAGSMVGALEALFVLQAVTPAEYQAFGYAWTLYGLIGGALGAAIGLVLLPVGSRLSAASTWCLGFAGVATPLGYTLGHHLLDRHVYDELGVPLGVSAALLGTLAIGALLAVWMGTNVLTKTPLRALATGKGVLVAWGGGLGLAWIFALSPAPGATTEPSPAAGLSPSVADRPDVILVVVDSLRLDALGVGGAPPGSTPNLDVFARDAVVFEQAVAAAAWTRPAIASIFTSLAPSSHGCVRGNDVLKPDVTTVAEVLAARGYLTAGFPDSAAVTAARGFGQGFAVFPFTPRFVAGASESTYGLSMYRAGLSLFTRFDADKDVETYYAPAEVQLGRAWAQLEANQGRRTFLYVHLMDPHEPWFNHPYDGTAFGRAQEPHPSATQARAIRGLYQGEVRYVDEQLGAFFETLRSLGRYTGSLIVVTSDHGEELGEDGVYWHGTTLAEEVIRVPLLVKLPGNERGGTRVPWQVRQIDIAPTLVDRAGAAVPAEWQGQELFPDSFDADVALLSPPPDDTPLPPGWRPPDWSIHPASRDALIEEDLEGYRVQALRRGGQKLVETLRTPPGNPRNTPAVAWYDLRNDPREERNLAGSGAGEEAAMKAALESLVEDRRRRAPGRSDVDPQERCRLCALGYGSPIDCEDCPPQVRPVDVSHP